jgi:hypothetical protein
MRPVSLGDALLRRCRDPLGHVGGRQVRGVDHSSGSKGRALGSRPASCLAVVVFPAPNVPLSQMITHASFPGHVQLYEQILSGDRLRGP